jgi:hypothetical protein
LNSDHLVFGRARARHLRQQVHSDDPQQEDIRRRFIETRYKLLPYLYTVMEDNTRTGLPLLRPLFLEFPDAAPDHHPLDIDLDASGEFMVGPDLLVAAPPFSIRQKTTMQRFPAPGGTTSGPGCLPATSRPPYAPRCLSLT